MRQPKPFVVEHKTRRTGGQRKPASSIWGNLDLGKALKDVETELDGDRPADAEAPEGLESRPGRGRD